MKRIHRRPSTVLSRALLAAFLVGLPGSREAFAQVLGRSGSIAISAPVAPVGSLGGFIAAPGLAATLSPASLALAPLAAPAAPAPAIVAVPVAAAPSAAKTVLAAAALQGKTLGAPALGAGEVKAAAAKAFDGSGAKGPGDEAAPDFVPSALSLRLSAPSSEGPDDSAPTPAELARVRAAIAKNHDLGDVLNRSSIVKLVPPSIMPFTRVFAAVEALAARGELARLSDGMYVRTDASAREGTGEGDLKLAHASVMAGVRLLNKKDSVSHALAVANFGDAVKLLELIEAPMPLRGEVAILLNNSLLEMTRSMLREYHGWLTGKGEDKGSAEFARIAAAREALKGRASAVDSPPPVLFNKEMSAWLAGIFDKIAFTAEARKEAGEALDSGVAIYRTFHRRAGSGDGAAPEGGLDTIEALKAKMKAIGMPEAIQETTTREFEKLAQMNPKDSEAQKIRTYIEWLTDVPWGKRTEDTADIAAAREILDREHAGLETVKERVLEFLAVRKKTGSKKGAIIAFTGPPGVGKTSIASSIAQALGRKFVRLSLGGVHDESVLRGHGRTYVGSMPGEIMRQMKTAGTINPVMLMDEVDKIGRNGAGGDPTAALLEILDPEQNNTFRDRYLDVPYDLSEVLFIVTSNELSDIPAPLRDRMEIIEFDGYTTLEKLAIAEKHVVPQKRALVGLKPEEAALTRNALRAIIEGYTMEAGVRGLREKIETLLRKISAWTETRGEKAPAVVDEKDVAKYLGVERFSARAVARNGVGVATGLAVNAYGGSTLNVEVSKEPGTGQLKLRKQFGPDIEDSAKNALKYVKQNAAKFGLADFDFTKHDIDINITPAGQVDGPSAGGLMVTAIVSALTGRAVAPGLAMTGEITMRGDILPIGGLKQKVMAAHRMGYTEVIFPYANLKDIENIPKEVRDGIKLTPARTYDDIYPVALD